MSSSFWIMMNWSIKDLFSSCWNSFLERLKTFNILSTIVQCLSFSSYVEASRLGVTRSSQRTLVMVLLCSWKCLNILYTEFQRVFTDWISLFFGRLCCSCLALNDLLAITECLKWPTSLKVAATQVFRAWCDSRPALGHSWRVCTEH